MSSLIQPDKRLIIWTDPLLGNIVLDKLDKNYNIESSEQSSPYQKLERGFAWYANEGKIEPKGWKLIEGEVIDFEETFNKEGELYYGNH